MTSTPPSPGRRHAPDWVPVPALPPGWPPHYTPTDDFRDALGRELSLTSVQAVVESLRAVGAQALAYAAVYAVGRDARVAWADAALLRADGTQWQLGDDFLWLVDPANARSRATLWNTRCWASGTIDRASDQRQPAN